MATMTAASATDIQTLYVAYFNRPADPLGLQSWLNTGASIQTIANGFSASDEYKATYGGKSPLDLVDSIYLNLFGRHAESAGLLYWAGKLTAGTETFASIVLTIANSAQNADLTAINDKVAAATAFTGSLTTGDQIRGYDGAAANAIAKAWLATVVDDASLAANTTAAAMTTVSTNATAAHDAALNPPTAFTLTTGVDNLVGTAGNDVFSAAPGTFNTGDTIDGGAGNNSFTWVETGAITGTPVGATVKNIQTANVITATTKAITLDSTSWSGLTALNTTNDAAAQTLTAANTTNVTASVTNAGASAVSVTGGANVTVNAGAVTTGTVNVAGNVGTVAVNTSVATGTQGQITVSSGSAVTVTETATNTGALGSTVTQGAVVVNGDATTATVNVKQSAAATGTPAVQQTATVTFAGTTAAAGDTFTVTVNGVTYTSAAAVGTENPAAVAALVAAAIPGGAPVTASVVGAVLTLTAKVAGTAFVASAAVGVHTGTVTEGAATAGVANVVASGNGIAGGVVQITDLNSSDTTGTKANTIKTASLDGFGAGSFVNSNALTSLSLANSAKDVTVTDNTATPTNTTLAVTVNNLGAGAALTDATIKTLNITTATKDSALNVTGAAVTALTVNGSNAVDLSNSTLGNLKTVVVSGAAGVTGNFTGANVTSVDSSASTGAVTVQVDDTKATFKGGSGVSTVTIIGDAVKSIAAGAGTSDVLVANANGATFTAANTGANVTGFEILRTGTASQGTFDMYTVFTTEKAIDVAAAAAGALIFNGAAAGTALSVDVAPTQNITYTLKTDTPNDTLNLSFGKATVDGADFTNGATNTVTIGNIENLNINSIGSNKAGTNVNTANVVDNAVTALKITGTESLTLSGLGGNTVKTIDTTGVGKGLTVDLTGITESTGGVTVTGGAGAVKFTDAGIAAGKTDTVTAGDGNNVITIGNTNSANASVTLGAGNNTVDLHLTQGKDTITVGNGNNILKGGAGNDIISVGSGTNTITGGAGADTITLAAHAGKVDTIVQNSGDSGLNNATVTQTSELTGGFDVVKGIAAGDKIDLSAMAASNTAVTLSAANLAGVAGHAVFATGTYDAVNGVFNYGATGADTVVTYDHAGGVFESIILVGYHAGANTAIAAGIITLA